MGVRGAGRGGARFFIESPRRGGLPRGWGRRARGWGGCLQGIGGGAKKVSSGPKFPPREGVHACM